MPHDIIENPTCELAPEINNFLADSIRAHFAVGYFFLSGSQAIAEHIPHLDQLRLLIGNVTNRHTIEQLAEGYHDLETLQRAVVASASYAARACGVRSAMPTAQALRLCPQAIVLPPRHKVYQEYPACMMAILSKYSLFIEPLSLEEAFPSTGSGHRLDVTGCQARWGSPEELAHHLQELVWMSPPTWSR